MLRVRTITLLFGIIAAAVTWPEAELFAQAPADPNGAPNPYRLDTNWLKMPDGRKLGQATGVDIEAIRRFVDRSTYRVVPVNGEVIESQQAVADRFARLGLIPKPINVSDIVWKWTPGS